MAGLELAWTNLDKPAKELRLPVGVHDTGHPTQKPLRLMRWCVEQLSSKVVKIFDPFMGSGTTGVAAVQLGRKFIGVEIEPRYFEIAVKRISEAIVKKQGGPLLATHQPEQLRLGA